MRRADRLFEIVQILRRVRRPIAAAAIARELETSVRTVYRDIATLVAQRVPITGEAGIGYILDGQFDMPPLMLSAEEVEAACLGALWVSTRGEPELARAAQNLLAKIEAVIPGALRLHIVDPAISVAPIADPPCETISAPALRAAIRTGSKVALRYERIPGDITDRIVWPVLLGYRDAGRILAAWCELRGGFRYFRTERMRSATVLDVRFPERPAQLKARWRAAMEVERAGYG